MVLESRVGNCNEVEREIESQTPWPINFAVSIGASLARIFSLSVNKVPRT